MPTPAPFLLGNVYDLVVWPLIALTAIGISCVAYGIFVERRWYRLAVYRLPILPAGSESTLTLLHLSDLHFVSSDAAKTRFLASLPVADVTVVTGDLLGEPEAAQSIVDALRPARGSRASFLVLGSNDYFAPQPLNYLAYFRKRRRLRRRIPSSAHRMLPLLEADGWIHLGNQRMSLDGDGRRLEIVGLDDPHIERHDLRAAVRQDTEAFGLAVVHSPDPAPELAALGYDLIVCGHTHGGQVRLPFVGALVTNSAVPTRLCMGLSRLGPALLHVSPGLGTSKYAPFRFLCRPEATILELTPASPQPRRTAQDSARVAGPEASTRSKTDS